MLRSLTCVLLLLAFGAALVQPADSRGRARQRSWQSPAPARDCTRLNGRYGYYGNPWCSPAELRAWARATTRTLPR